MAEVQYTLFDSKCKEIKEDVKTKICSKCGEEFSATSEYFYKRINKGYKYDLSARCKKCQNEYSKQYKKKKYIEKYGCDEETRRKLVFKKCKKCGKLLPITTKYFNKDKNCIDGFRLTCKICSGQSKTYSIKNKTPQSKQKGYKVCRKCLKEYPATSYYFRNHSSYQDGLESTCKQCKHKNNNLFEKLDKQRRLKEQVLKICFTCKRELSATTEYFTKDTQRKDGLRNSCKKCSKQKRDKNRKINNEKNRLKAQEFTKYSKLKANKLFCDETRKDKKGLLQVKCKNSLCQKWFNPTNSQVQHRISAINGSVKLLGEENHFYCSDKCKKDCVLYKRRVEDILNAENRQYSNHECYYNASELTIWANQVKNKANHTCEICGSKENLQAHHIEPKSINPEKALDISNGLCLCKKCHSKVHQENNGCRLNELRKCNVAI